VSVRDSVLDTSEGKAVAKIRVVITDAHRQMVAAVRQTLNEEFDVVGTAENGQEAIDAVLTLNPDALVIDISMPIPPGTARRVSLPSSGKQDGSLEPRRSPR
jgi:CheY-like chemotaxis protein